MQDCPILNVRVYEDGKTTYCEPSLITKLRGKLLSSSSTLIFGQKYSIYMLEQVIKHLPDITDNYIVDDEVPFKYDGLEIDNALVIKGKYIIIVIGWQKYIRIYPQGDPPKRNIPVTNNVSMKLEADYDFRFARLVNVALRIRPEANSIYTFKNEYISGCHIMNIYEKNKDKLLRHLICYDEGICRDKFRDEIVHQGDIIYKGVRESFGAYSVYIGKNGDKFHHVVFIDSKGNITRIYKRYDDYSVTRKEYKITVWSSSDFSIVGDFPDEKYIKMITENKLPVTFEYI